MALDAAGFGLHGLVPARVGAALTWSVMAAERRQLPDVGEADRALRAALPEAADALAALDVARWRPEVADRLMNLRHRPRPPHHPACRHAAWSSPSGAARPWRSWTLALEDDGGAQTALEAEARRAALLPLGPRGPAGAGRRRVAGGLAARTEPGSGRRAVVDQDRGLIRTA